MILLVETRTEQIRCILCNKHLDLTMSDGKELFICSECQAYFCPDCLQAIENYSACPAARLLGAKEHELKFLKILPPKLIFSSGNLSQIEKNKPSTVKILPKKSIKVIESKSERNKAVKKKNNFKK